MFAVFKFYRVKKKFDMRPCTSNDFGNESNYILWLNDQWVMNAKSIDH